MCGEHRTPPVRGDTVSYNGGRGVNVRPNAAGVGGIARSTHAARDFSTGSKYARDAGKESCSCLRVVRLHATAALVAARPLPERTTAPSGKYLAGYAVMRAAENRRMSRELAVRRPQ